MKKFTTERPVTLYSGQVELSAEQARDRQGLITAVKADDDGAGTYAITAQNGIQFKAGEVFGYDGDPGKNGGLVEAKKEDLARAKAKQDAAQKERERGEQAERQGRLDQEARERAAEQDRQQREQEQARARGEAHAKRDEK
jgi:hypothetical protein